MIQRLRLAGAGFAELRESTVNNGKCLARIGAMTDDVRKLRERGDYLLKRAQDTRGAGAWDDFNGWASDNWPAISRALAALERWQATAERAREDQSDAGENCRKVSSAFSSGTATAAAGPASDPQSSLAQERFMEEHIDILPDAARRASSDGPTLVEEITEYLSGLLPNTRNCARSALLLARARDEIMRLDGLLGEHWKLARVEQRRIAALEAQLATQAPVIEAAKTWEKLTRNDRGKHGDEICRNLQQAIRALPIVERDADK